MNKGPLPTRVVFLSELSNLPHGTKVRFLGCVTHYTLSTGTLTLQHAYPPPLHGRAMAQVDVNLLLETMKSTDTQVGEWVNVMGYVERAAGEVVKARRALEAGNHSKATKLRDKGVNKLKEEVHKVKVQAIMLWSAGSVKLGEYEKNLEDRQRMESEKKAGANC